MARARRPTHAKPGPAGASIYYIYLLDAAMHAGRVGSDDCAKLNPRSIKKAVERRPGHPRRPDGRLATMPTSQIGVGDM
eukprot:COSAG01_NODE_656_length_14462_cov_20.440716_12_plen_79_part_00